MTVRRLYGFAIGAAVVSLGLAACTSGADTAASSTASSTSASTAVTSPVQRRPPPSSHPPVRRPGRCPDRSPIPGLDQSAIDVMNKPEYANGQWAIAVKDIDTGEQIIAYNDDLLFEPGSVVKTYSTGAAWQEFGPDSTVVTPVKRTGEVVDGTLTGDLVLVGKGDLTMGGRTKPDGTVDFTNLDHNDANGIPGATLTTGGSADRTERAGRAGQGGRHQRRLRRRDRRRPAVGQRTRWLSEPITPIIINQNVIDLTITPGAEGQPATTDDVAGGGAVDRGHPGADGGRRRRRTPGSR